MRGDKPVQLRSPTIGLAGPYASRNLGDTATQLAVMEAASERCPGARFVGIAPEPEDTARSLSIAGFPLDGCGQACGADFPRAAWGRRLQRWHAWRRIDRAAAKLNLLIFSGGGQLDDFWGGPWGHPWAMWWWTRAATRHHVPVAFLGTGLDRLQARLSRRFAVSALERAQWRVFRDADTQRSMRDLGLTSSSELCPDLAFALHSLAVARRDAVARDEVVINPISHRAWSTEADERHQRYVDSLVALGIALTRRGVPVCVSSTQAAMDGALAEEVAARIRAAQGNAVVRVSLPCSVQGFIDTVAGARMVVASRLHAAILALGAGTPVVALSPQAKVASLMHDAQLDDWSTPLQSVEVSWLTARVDTAMAAHETLTAQARQLASNYAARLRGIFDAVFADIS